MYFKFFLQELLDFKEKMDEVVEHCFKNNDKFVIALKVKLIFNVELSVKKNLPPPPPPRTDP
jgi:hypothetical protein